MNIFLKYIVNNIKEKKGRLLLLVITIALSVALVSVSLSMVEMMSHLYIETAKEEFGSYNVEIRQTSHEPFEKIDFSQDDAVNKVLQIRELNGVFTQEEKTLRGILVDQEELLNYSAMRLVHGDADALKERSIAISTDTQDAYDIALNDTIEIMIDNRVDAYEVVAIYETHAFFAHDSDNYFTVLIADDAFENPNHEITKYYLDIREEDASSWVHRFNDSHQDEDVIASFNYDNDTISQQMEWVKLPMSFMTLLCCLLAFLILYSSFQTMINERLSTLGIFFSQGAEFNQVRGLIALEGALYGVLGAIVGIGFGFGLTEWIGNYLTYGMDYSLYSLQPISIEYYIVAAVFGILFSMIVAIIPVYRLKNQEVKDILFHQDDSYNQFSIKKLAIGVLFLVIAFYLHFFQMDRMPWLSMPATLFFLLGVVILIPYFTSFISRIIEKSIGRIVPLVFVAARSFQKNKNYKNNITLFSVGIIAITIIVSLVTATIDVISGSYRQMNYDYRLQFFNEENETIMDSLNDIDGIRKIYQISYFQSFLDNDPTQPITIAVVQPKEYIDFDNYISFDDKVKQLNQLEQYEDGIILSKRQSVNQKIQINDVIQVSVDNTIYSLKVLSIVNPKMYMGGNYSIISYDTYKSVFDKNIQSVYYIQSSLSKQEIEDALSPFVVDIQTVDDQIAEGEQEMDSFIKLLIIFALFAITMATLGIGTNMNASFIERKRELAIYTSIGLSDVSRSILILLESVMMGLISTFLGLSAARFSLSFVADIFNFVLLDLNMYIQQTFIYIVVIATVLLSIIASLPAIIDSRNIQLVNELKKG